MISRSIIFPCILAISLPSSLPGGETSVRMWEETLVVPTYPVGPAEKNPIFYTGRVYQGAKGPMYPYPLLDKLAETKEDRAYKAVYLENEYIQICILPELGGRIFSGRDKTNGYDFFYRQGVVKPALIGMVGAWISGGVEWNVPHHHRVSTFLPVDCRLLENPDGSKTVWVGETEWRHRMRWIVGLTLRPGRSTLEATVRLFNRTPLAHSILYFSNVAVHANEDYQVIFPPGTEFGTQHGKREFVRWPVADGSYGGMDLQGVDVSWWKNLTSPVSIFAWNYEDDFFGGYDHGKRAGVVHVADHHTVPGKKFFEFANGPEGRMWDRILTDADGPYLELMSGAYSDNQPDYSWCQPTEVKEARQSWYPIRELGGIQKANLDAAVNLGVKDGKVRVAFNATSERAGVRAILRAGGKTLSEESVAIGPGKPFVQEAALPAGLGEYDLEAALVAADGKELVSCRPAPRKGAPMTDPVRPPPPPKDIATSEELYLAGLRLEQFYNPAREPYPYYEEALRRDPGDSRANTALGILSLKRGMFQEAEKRLRTAVERITRNHTRPKDGEPYYYLGVALRCQGRGDEAADAFQRAAWSLAWSAASNHELAEIACRRGDLAGALDLAGRSLAANGLNARALDLRAGILRKLGRNGEAADAAAQALALDPLDFRAMNERRLALGSAKALEEMGALLRGEPQSHLELAADYASAGFLDEAIEVLERLTADPRSRGAAHPMVHYWLGHLWSLKGDRERALKHRRDGRAAPPDYCFPFRLEEIAILREAMKADPTDARAPYYLGNLLYDLQPEEAMAAWERSRGLDGSFPTVQRNLGLASARLRNDLPNATASLERAVELDPRDPKLLIELDTLREAGGASPEERLAFLERRGDVAARRDDCLTRKISLQVLLGKLDDAIRSLEGHHFHLWEGGEEEFGNIHELHVDAFLLRGRKLLAQGRAKEALQDFETALEYPERYEIGRPRRGGRLVEIHHEIGLAREALGDAAGARAAFEAAAAERISGGERRDDPRFFQGLALRKLGDEEKAKARFEDLLRLGKERLEAKTSEDFFAKFGGKQSDSARKARAHVLLGLGHRGLGRPDPARQEFEEALRLDPTNLRARTMLETGR